MSWKVALYDMVHARNQTEVNYDWECLRGTVADEAYLMRCREQQERRRTLHLFRGYEPVRSETRLAVRRAEECGRGEVMADIRLLVQLEGRIRGTPVTEERWELERVWVKEVPAGSGKWRITSISPVVEGDGGFPAADLGAAVLHGSTGHTFGDLGVRSESEAGSGAAAGAVAGTWGEAGAGNSSGYPGTVIGSGLSAGGPLLNKDLITPPEGRVPPSAVRYNREKAREYAERWWNSYNPAFIAFDVDCTNYVSQCIHAGGIPMNHTGRRETGWWFKGRSGGQEVWSFSWTVANALQVYLGGSRESGLRAARVDSPQELEIGDVICYSWNGDGRYGHTTIVTGFDPTGMPLVNAHTVNSRNRYWDYSDSYAWSERTAYRFFHILD